MSNGRIHSLSLQGGSRTSASHNHHVYTAVPPTLVLTHNSSLEGASSYEAEICAII